MPLQRYGVLKGRPSDATTEEGADTPHYQVHVVASSTHYRLAVNVKSQQSPSELLYLMDEDFHHPLTTGFPDLAQTFTPLQTRPGGLALDFIRGNLFDRLQMRPLPFHLPGPDNDLNEKIDHYVRRALRDPQALLYAFGERWGPEDHQQDKVFHFEPGNGIHDIHMNQGNVGRFVTGRRCLARRGSPASLPFRTALGRAVPSLSVASLAYRRRDRSYATLAGAGS